MRSFTCLALLAIAACAIRVTAQAEPVRPKIIGISHAAFYVNDLAKARAFYEGFLGYQEPFSIKRKGGGDLVWIKINDRQTIELFPGSEVAPHADRLYHIALEVEDAEAMRVYLASKGVKVPEKVEVGKIGNKNYFIHDPNGNIVEIVQYMPEGWTMKAEGKFMADTRISVHMRHVGVMVGQLDDSLHFYGDILGFKEIWRGSTSGKYLNWVHMKLPESDDFIEFMLYGDKPTEDRLHTMHHVCLEVPDIQKASATLQARTLPDGCKPPTEMKVGVNGKRQINYYDPDGTRIEIMEPNTFDGKAAPPSKAPPPSHPKTESAGTSTQS